jgi:tRNA (mo5U34)-methyltransferase
LTTASGGPNRPAAERERIEKRVRALGEWFHNMNLGGVQTAPRHFLGDYPSFQWQRVRSVLPADIRGRSVLDIGCNAGFFSIEMKRLGAARVLGIDHDHRYLAQARLAAEVTGVEVELRHLSVYDVALLGERFDIVLFMGVLYHLRYPLLALDLIRDHVARDLFLCQSLERGSRHVEQAAEDYGFDARDIFERPDFPRLHFIEERYAGVPTNWWIPNRACSEAMLRSAGFTVLHRPVDEVYLCEVAARNKAG